MGNTESTTNVVSQNNQLTMNKNDFNSNVEQINSNISNTTVDMAKSCSAAMNNNQSIQIKNMNVRGDFNLDTKQDMTAALTFSCIQSNEVRQTSGSSIITGITDSVANSADNQMIQALESAAKTKTDAGFGAIGNFESNSNVNTINNTTTVNQSVVNLNKVIKNIVESNFNTKTVDDCVSKVMNRQDLDIQNVNVGGNANMVIDQKMAATAMGDCIQKSGVGSEILSAATTALGVTVKNENKSSSQQESKASAASESKTEGVGTALAQTLCGIAGVVDSVGGAVGSILGGILSGPMMIIGAIVLCCLLCCACSFLLPKLMGGNAPPPGGQPGANMVTSDMNGEMSGEIEIAGDMGGETYI